jgi:hypothetical protein
MVGAGVLFTGCLLETALSDPDVREPDPVTVEETFEQAAEPDLDVLFVVDGTGSMAEEQAAIGEAAEPFLAALDGLELAWQVGVASMDLLLEGALQGRPWIITPGTAEPEAALAAALAVGTASSPPSAGLDAAALALDAEQADNAGFRRAGAGLHVIFVSDGEDQSGEVLGDDPVAAMLELLAAQETATGHPARASAVVGDVPDGCSGAGGEALAGERYTQVAEAAGGVVASICAADFGDLGAAVSDVAAEWQTRFALQGDPEDGTVDVTVAGEELRDGWSIDHAGPALVFDAAPAAGSLIVVRYTLAEEGG